MPNSVLRYSVQNFTGFTPTGVRECIPLSAECGSNYLVEYTEYYLPAGSAVVDEYWEFVPRCTGDCCDQGSGSGSGGGTGGCDDIESVAKCGCDNVPLVLNIVVTGSGSGPASCNDLLTGSATITYNATMGQWTGTYVAARGNTVTVNLICSTGTTWNLLLRTFGGTQVFLSATSIQCCPVDFQFSGNGQPLCNGTVTASVTTGDDGDPPPAGECDGGVWVRFIEVDIPASSVEEGTFCLQPTVFGCCEDVTPITVECCGYTIPSVLYATVISVDSDLACCEDMLGYTFPLYYCPPLGTWYGVYDPSLCFTGGPPYDGYPAGYPYVRWIFSLVPCAFENPAANDCCVGSDGSQGSGYDPSDPFGNPDRLKDGYYWVYLCMAKCNLGVTYDPPVGVPPVPPAPPPVPPSGPASSPCPGRVPRCKDATGYNCFDCSNVCVECLPDFLAYFRLTCNTCGDMPCSLVLEISG